jgi:hypothetical protein
LVGWLEHSHRNHIVTAVLDAIGILLPRRKNIHNPASPCVFSVSIHEILFGIPVFPQSLDQAIAADRIPWFQFTKELSQILRPGYRLEKSRKICDEKGGRRFL